VKASCPYAIAKYTRYAPYGVYFCKALSFCSAIFSLFFPHSRGQIHGFLSPFPLFLTLSRAPDLRSHSLYVSCPMFFFFLFISALLPYALLTSIFPVGDSGFEARSYVYSIIRYICSREACGGVVGSWLWWIWLQSISCKS